MDHKENTSESRRTAKDAAGIVALAVVVTTAVVVASTVADVVTRKTIDAVVNTLTFARKSKRQPVNPK